MEILSRRDLIGVFVWRVMEGARCCTMPVYQERDGTLEWRIEKSSSYDLRRATRVALRQYTPGVLVLWRNDRLEAYWLQLHPRWTPGIVRGDGDWQKVELDSLKEA